MIDSILYFYRQREIFKLFIMPKQKAKSARAVSYKLLQVVDNSHWDTLSIRMWGQGFMSQAGRPESNAVC